MRKCLPLLLVYILFVSPALCGGVVLEEAIVQEEKSELIHSLLGASVQERWRACIRILSQYDTLNEYHDDPGMGHRISDEMYAKIEAFVEREFR